MIIFGSFVTTFEAMTFGVIFEAAGALVNIGSSLKSNQQTKLSSS